MSPACIPTQPIVSHCFSILMCKLTFSPRNRKSILRMPSKCRLTIASSVPDRSNLPPLLALLARQFFPPFVFFPGIRRAYLSDMCEYRALFVAIGYGVTSGPLALLVAFIFWATVIFFIAQCRKTLPSTTWYPELSLESNLL